MPPSFRRGAARRTPSRCTNSSWIIAHGDDAVGQCHARRPCRTSRRSRHRRVQSATCSSTITSPRPSPQLINAINTLKAANVTDLVLDIRYNGGGYLDIASELAFMIAGSARTAGRTFEQLVFNAQAPDRDPFTGAAACADAVPHHDAGIFGRRAARLCRRSICHACSCSPARAPVRRASRSSTACAASACRSSRSARAPAASLTASFRKTTAARPTSRSSSRA